MATQLYSPDPCPGCGGRVKLKPPSKRGPQPRYCDDPACRKRKNQADVRREQQRLVAAAKREGKLGRLPAHQQTQVVREIHELEQELQALAQQVEDINTAKLPSALGYLRAKTQELATRTADLKALIHDD